MGDHRASIKIEAEFHGVTRKMDAWINYSGWAESAEVEGVDDRIVKFFQGLWREGMAVYDQQMADFYTKQYGEEIERAERLEFAKLKAKYDPEE